MTGHAHGHGDDHGPVLHGPRWLSLSTALVLGLAALFAGITAWHGAVLSNHGDIHLTLSTQQLTSANALQAAADRSISTQRQLFLAYETTSRSGDKVAANEVLSTMDASSRAALDWWLRQPKADRPPTPFSSANPAWDAPAMMIAAENAMDLQREYALEAQEETGRAHTIELFSAFLTIAFLAGGLTGLFESMSARIALLAVSVVVLVICIGGTVVYW